MAPEEYCADEPHARCARNLSVILSFAVPVRNGASWIICQGSTLLRVVLILFSIHDICTIGAVAGLTLTAAPIRNCFLDLGGLRDQICRLPPSLSLVTLTPAPTTRLCVASVARFFIYS